MLGRYKNNWIILFEKGENIRNYQTLIISMV